MDRYLRNYRGTGRFNDVIPARTIRRGLVAAAVCFLLISARDVPAQALSCGAPPPAKPHRIKGGESFPPLPLPVTPLRRTERKRPPAPPILIGKLRYGEKRQAVGPEGKPYTYFDWKSDPADAHKLLRFACPKLGINYRVTVIDEKDFKPDPAQMPILYVTGHQAFRPSEDLTDRIRAYVAAGGTVLGDACCGSPPFVESFLDFAKKLFPKRRFSPLPPEHALFRAHFDIAEVAFQEGTKVIKNAAPEVYAIEIGDRAAVLFWRYDMSCGWDSHVHDIGHRYKPEDALRLGTNILAYTLAYQPLGRFLATQKVYRDEAGDTTGDPFVFGQLIHQGDWDPDPSAVGNLLRAVNANSSINVEFQRRVVDPLSDGLSDVPFLYMTGHHDFRFSEKEVDNLREYLENGGFILADPSCGRKAFDRAFRREIKRILPGRRLEPVPADSPIYRGLYRIETISHTLTGKSGPPRLEAIKIDGLYAVVYSKDDLGNGWEGIEHPFEDGVAREDSLRLAMNIVTYALTH